MRESCRGTGVLLLPARWVSRVYGFLRTSSHAKLETREGPAQARQSPDVELQNNGAKVVLEHIRWGRPWLLRGRQDSKVGDLVRTRIVIGVDGDKGVTRSYPRCTWARITRREANAGVETRSPM